MRLIALLVAFGATFALAGCGDDFSKSVFVESHVVTAGRFEDFLIGETKRAALQAIFKINPNAVLEPAPEKDFTVSSKNLENISFIESVNGIRLFDYSGTAINIFFVNGRISKVDASYKNKLNQFYVGDTKQETIAKLLAVLKTDNNFSVVPIVNYEGTKAYKIKDVMGDANSKLFNYDAWQFEVPTVKPAGAYYTLYFSERADLVKIEFRRPRVRIEL